MRSGPASAAERRVDQAWRLRLKGKSEESQAAYLKLRESLGLGRAQLLPGPGWSDGQAPETVALAIDVVLLGGSLARAQGKRDKALAAVAWAESTASGFELGDSFYLSLERGIAAHIQGDFERALQRFTDAQSVAFLPWQKAIALGNLLIELELLGIDATRTLAAFNDVCAALKQEDQFEAITRPLALYNARAAFHQGRFAHALAIAAERERTSSVDQVHYFGLWMRTLPYTTAHAPLVAAEVERLLAAANGVYQKDYRSRTLRGVLHPDDLEGFVPYDAADRVYAWTWRWLVSPERFPVFDAIKVLAALAPWARKASLTFDDRQLVANALLWLGLFAHEPRSRIDKALARFERDADGGRTASVLRFERELLEYLYALRDGTSAEQETRAAQLAGHPHWDNDELVLADLARALLGEPHSVQRLAPLHELLLALRSLAQEARVPDDVAIVVNVLQGTLTISGTDGPLVSSSMARALSMLREREVVTCSDLLLQAYGIGSYSPVVHERKIFNLLARLKQVLPPKPVIKVKSGFVVATGGWDHVQIVGIGAHAAQLAAEDGWTKVLESARMSDSAAMAAPITAARAHAASPRVRAGAMALSGTYTRGQIERLAGRPRSTVARWLAESVRDGLVERKGQARATSYTILEPEAFLARLEQQGDGR